MAESGEIALAMGAFSRLIAGCRHKRLYRERYVCVVRRDHPEFVNGMSVDSFCVPPAVVDPGG